MTGDQTADHRFQNVKLKDRSDEVFVIAATPKFAAQAIRKAIRSAGGR